MTLFTNKNDFKDRPEIFKLLTALEVAHAKQDEFSASILLTRLAQYGIKLVQENICNQDENRVQ